MKFIPVKTPYLVQRLLPNYIWHMPRTEKTIYLTFDDGPIPEVTEWALGTLATYNAKATFFCIGDNVRKHPKIFNKLLEEGHTAANHTFHHIKGWKTSTPDYLENIALAEAEMAKHSLYLKQPTKLFRPPYGEITIPKGRALLKMGYKIIMWESLAIDWKPEIPVEKSASYIINNTQEGSIAVFHDSLKAERNMKYALEKTLDHFSELGFEFKALE
ncbi:polysaccharide deacetylase family protein [Spongiivirga citrea]|uniref:Polysaccharide deacetylase family protein n=1 Tax=Spongiivirga citrea TaxID=1481457 RepID=A0A6M0CM99_9FLAO|nr:polysaccharide deacetylase family protein [Spongiivirga citrea]NER18093.1 polysaccharide deacetylase family protein [Spongiivirga citrea]